MMRGHRARPPNFFPRTATAFNVICFSSLHPIIVVCDMWIFLWMLMSCYHAACVVYFQVQNATNANVKEKHEADLKKEIKKLQVWPYILLILLIWSYIIFNFTISLSCSSVVFRRTSLSIFCCCLKSHLFSLSCPAFSLICTVPAQWLVISDSAVIITFDIYVACWHIG